VVYIISLVRTESRSEKVAGKSSTRWYLVNLGMFDRFMVGSQV